MNSTERENDSYNIKDEPYYIVDEGENVENEEITFLKSHIWDDELFTEKIKRLYLKDVYNLCVDSNDRERQSFDFAVKNIIIENKACSVGSKSHWNREEQRIARFLYFDHYVLIGIPIRVYNWFLKKTVNSKQLPLFATIDGKSLPYCHNPTESDGYTWICARPRGGANVGCYAYIEKQDSIVYTGTLGNTMATLKSNVIGVGHFNVFLCQSKNAGSGEYFLKFHLLDFQLTNTTKITSNMLKSFTRDEPPAHVKDLLKI